MRWLFFGLAFCLSGCGYRFGSGSGFDRLTTICVPFAGGDDEGKLTSHLVRELTRSGAFSVVDCGGELTLQVNILQLKNRNIGYRYDQKSCDCFAKTIIPTERRKILLAEVAVLSSGKPLYGPVLIEASLDYDFDYCQVKDEVNVLSMGQLVDIETAADSAENPLYKRLSEKVVDYLINVAEEVALKNQLEN